MSGLEQFNVWSELGRLLCPACGFDAEFQVPRYTDEHGLRIFICEACLWEPGHDDADAVSPDDVRACLRDYRRNWDGKAPWLGSGDPPRDWNGKQQLQRLFVAAPHVR
jgi:hypothetical protein